MCGGLRPANNGENKSGASMCKDAVVQTTTLGGLIFTGGEEKSGFTIFLFLLEKGGGL